MTFIILPMGKEAASRDRSLLFSMLIRRPCANVELLLVYIVELELRDLEENFWEECFVWYKCW